LGIDEAGVAAAAQVEALCRLPLPHSVALASKVVEIVSIS
jgi:hypothetical protein